MLKKAKSKSKKPVERVLVAGITPAQDELLRTVQYRIGTLGGRDTLFAAVRKYVQQSASDVKPPTKRQVGAFVKGEPAMQRQQTTGAALPEHKPVAVVRRSRPLMYVQFDAMQLPASDLKETVTYMPKSGKKKVTVPLVRKFLVIMVDAFSKFVWVRMLATPKGAGIAAAWDGLKTNPSVIGTAKALDSICQEIDADLQMEDPPRRLKDLNLKIGTDGGGEMTSPDFERVVKKWNMRQELGAPGRPMSQALAESHVGVWKRKFANWVRTRMDAVGLDDEESKKALQIKQSWPDLAETITASVNTAWMTKFPDKLSRQDVHHGSPAVIKRVRDYQDKEFKKRSKNYEMDNVPKFQKGDIVRRLVARSGKLDAAFSKRLYRITRVKQYKANRGAGFELEPIAEPGKKEPGLYRAQQLQRVLMYKNKPVQNKLSAADVDALNDPDAREYVPWRVLDKRGIGAAEEWLIQWQGYGRDQATYEKADDFRHLLQPSS
jgi:predicted secreted Zn-dependent protease